VHGVKFVQVTDGELAQTRFGFLLDQITKVLLGVLALLHLRLQNFLQLVDLFERLGVPLLLLSLLLQRLALYLLLNTHVVVFEPSKR